MEQLVRLWLSSTDEALELLSNHYESRLSNLPRWVLSHRRITIYSVTGKPFYVIRVIPQDELDTDVFELQDVVTDQTLREAFAPWAPSFGVQNVPTAKFGLFFGGMSITEKGNPLALPVAEFPGLIIQMTADLATTEFTAEKGRHHALDLWNNQAAALGSNGSFPQQARNAFRRLTDLIKRKAFLERRVHRYIDGHAKLLLPDHELHYFEHVLYRDQDVRKADFILRQKAGFPPLLVELENPVHRLFLKDRSLSKEASHAKAQIAEWCEFIDTDGRNTQGEMQFLAGPKQRLVVIGRGMDDPQAMESTRFTDTTMWTYDYLIHQAKIRWNGILEEQARLLALRTVPRID